MKCKKTFYDCGRNNQLNMYKMFANIIVTFRKYFIGGMLIRKQETRFGCGILFIRDAFVLQ